MDITELEGVHIKWSRFEKYIIIKNCFLIYAYECLYKLKFRLKFKTVIVTQFFDLVNRSKIFTTCFILIGLLPHIIMNVTQN